MDSGHSESEFYYPDEVEKFSDEENIGSQQKENEQKAQFTRKIEEIPADELNILICQFLKEIIKERWQIVLIGNATIISKKPATMSKRQELQTEHSQRPKTR